MNNSAKIFRDLFRVKDSVPSFIGLTPGLYDLEECLKHWIEHPSSDDYPYRETMMGLAMCADDTTYVNDTDYVNKVVVRLGNIFEVYNRSELEEIGNIIKELMGKCRSYEAHFVYNQNMTTVNDEDGEELTEYTFKLESEKYIVEFEAITDEFSAQHSQLLRISPVADLEADDIAFEKYKALAEKL